LELEVGEEHLDWLNEMRKNRIWNRAENSFALPIATCVDPNQVIATVQEFNAIDVSFRVAVGVRSTAIQNIFVVATHCDAISGFLAPIISFQTIFKLP